MDLFRGHMDAHGTYDSETKSESKGGKMEIRASARTLRSPVTETIWDKHLGGKYHLGVIPIRGDNTCYWGAIDIDDYTVNHSELVDKIARRNLPLVVCRTKSGGAHLFLFMNNPLPAEELVPWLRNVAAALGYGDHEVFPKQTQVLIEKGDLGNWLNMPYFGGDRAINHGMKSGGIAMSLGEFINNAERARIDRLPTLKNIREKTWQKGDIMDDGPPCLQHLSEIGFPEGSRNNGLMAMGVFCRKKFGDNWETMLNEMNTRFMIPPLPLEEVMGVIKGLRKKDYNYRCKDVPIRSHCNAAVCRTRRHGVGGGDCPSISGLSVLATDPPLWFADIDGERLELSTDELMDNRKFRKVCLERLIKLYQPLDQRGHTAMVSEAMSIVVAIDAPDDIGIRGQFQELLDDFLTNRHRGRAMEDILTGRPWEDEEMRRHWFQLRYLQEFLERNNFKHYTRGQIATRLKNLGGGSCQKNVKGNTRNCWWLPSDSVQKTPELAIPAREREVI